jgi:hypothetical protein
MLHQVRLALVAAFAAVMMSGFVAPVVAAESDAVVNECTKQAQDNGLEGAEKADFIKDCVAAPKS